jgi:hypothetical protein
MKKYQRHTKKLTNQILTQEGINPKFFHYYFWEFGEDDEDDDHYPYGYYPHGDYDVNYEYASEIDPEIKIVRRYNVPSMVRSSRNLQNIDMNSIYSREMLRQKKIDKILGIDCDDVSNTIENILKLKLP